MSLLMDALRKAEREKKAAAEKLREKQKTLGGSESGGEEKGLSLSLEDDYDRHAGSNAKPESEDDTPEPGEVAGGGYDPDATLAESASALGLSPLDEPAATEDAGQDPDEAQQSEDAAEPPAEEFSLSLEQDDTGEEPEEPEPPIADSDDEEEAAASGQHRKFTIDMSGEASEETLGSSEKAEEDTLLLERQYQKAETDDSATLNETLEQTRTYSGSATREATREYAAAAATRDTPATAQNVFAARKKSSYTTYTVGTLVVLVAIGLAAYAVFYYYSVTPVNREIPSPRVAQGIEATEALPVREPDAVRERIEAEDIRPPEVAETEPTETQLSPAPADVQPDTEPDQGMADSPAEEVSAALPDRDSPEPVKPEPAASDDSTAMAEKTPAKPELELKPRLLQITRSKGVDRENQALIDAYRAFRSGDLETANSLYQSVQAREPGNQDALLGLAAVAVSQGRYQQAYRYYGEVLELNPANPNARAAVINLQERLDPAAGESGIRRLLEQHPDSAYLHFALGNIYSRQQRWSYAQQAYFNAYAGDSENPDYALNLAISLDHMGKRDAALDYYRKAVDLAKESVSAFDISTVRQRISELSQ